MFSSCQSERPLGWVKILTTHYEKYKFLGINVEYLSSYSRIFGRTFDLAETFIFY